MMFGNRAGPRRSGPTQPALCTIAAEEPAGSGRDQLGADAVATARLAHDRDIAGVTAEGTGVAVDPSQRGAQQGAMVVTFR